MLDADGSICGSSGAWRRTLIWRSCALNASVNSFSVALRGCGCLAMVEYGFAVLDCHKGRMGFQNFISWDVLEVCSIWEPGGCIKSAYLFVLYLVTYIALRLGCTGNPTTKNQRQRSNQAVFRFICPPLCLGRRRESQSSVATISGFFLCAAVTAGHYHSASISSLVQSCLLLRLVIQGTGSLHIGFHNTELVRGMIV